MHLDPSLALAEMSSSEHLRHPACFSHPSIWAGSTAMSHPQWTISQDQKEGPRGSGSPHNLVSEKHLAVKGPARGTLLGRPSLRQPQTRGDAMLWASHGSRGARTSSALIQLRRLSFTLPTPVPQRTPRPSALIFFSPKQPHAASRTSSLVGESRGVWSTEGTWEKPRRPPPARARHHP